MYCLAMDSVQSTKGLRDWRASCGVDQETLGSLAKVSRATISALERDQYPPQPETAGAICKALGKLLKTTVNTWEVWPQHFQSPEQLKGDSTNGKQD